MSAPQPRKSTLRSRSREYALTDTYVTTTDEAVMNALVRKGKIRPSDTIGSGLSTNSATTTRARMMMLRAPTNRGTA